MLAEGVISEESVCISILHLNDVNCLLVAFDTGQLVQLELEMVPAQLEEVGDVPAGLAAVQLSPDLEMIVLVSSSMSVITMTRHGEIRLGVCTHSLWLCIQTD